MNLLVYAAKSDGAAQHLLQVTEEIVPAVKKILDTYRENRCGDDERFVDFCERIGIEKFQELVK